MSDGVVVTIETMYKFYGVIRKRVITIELNKVYCMDNLELLKQLPNESIDIIYCDILYNTGKKFKDYDDNLGTPQEAIEWYKPRLVEMKRVLKDTGSIYLQMDYRLVHYMKVEMDSIFGIENFKNEIIWKYGLGNSRALGRYQTKHDNILFYTKTNEYIFNNIRGEVTPQMEAKYCHEDELGKYMISKGKKYYLKGGKKIEDVIEVSNMSATSKERVGYDTQKPKELLEIFIKQSSIEGSIVADFFCGSGTSLVVAKELGRNYIGCDINPRAIEITEERLKEI